MLGAPRPAAHAQSLRLVRVLLLWLCADGRACAGRSPPFGGATSSQDQSFDYILCLTTYCVYAIRSASSLFEGRLRRHPEGGAGSGVLRRRLVTACLGRPGTPPARHYDLAARSSLHGAEDNCPPL